MTVSVANKPVYSAAGLSELGRLALAFIDGGIEWLDWAVNDNAGRYDFRDESVLVADVQQGLHNSGVTLLPTLRLLVSPVKLMTLGVADLRTLARAEGGDTSPVVATQVGRILADHQLLTQDEFTAAAAFLAELGVADAPVLRIRGLDESLAITALLRAPEEEAGIDPALRREAAGFALRQGRTPLEFADYYRAYLGLAARPGMEGGTAEERERRAETALRTLLPLLFGALECPQVGRLAAPYEVAAAVGGWIRRGRVIGFARLSEGVQQIVRNTGFTAETGAAAQAVVTDYLAGARNFLKEAPPWRGVMGQDGATCIFPIESGSQRAELHLGSSGTITLRLFRRSPSAQPEGRTTQTDATQETERRHEPARNTRVPARAPARAAGGG